MSWRMTIVAGAVAVGLGAACGGAPPADTVALPIPTGVESGPKPGRTQARSCRLPGNAGAIRRLGGAAPIGSTVALAEWGDRTVALASDEDAGALQVVDIDSRSQLATTRLGGRPKQLVLLGDGRVVVALSDRAELEVLAAGAEPTSPLTSLCRVATALEPVALALTPDDRTLLVGSSFGGALAAYDSGPVTRSWQIELGREARAVAVSADGKRAFVAHAAGGYASVVELGSQEARRVWLDGRTDSDLVTLRDELRKKVQSKGQPLTGEQREKLIGALREVEEQLGKRAYRYGGRVGCQGFALARSSTPSARLFAPQVLVDTGDPTRRSTGYGEPQNRTVVANVAVLDESTGFPLASSLRIGNDTYSYGGGYSGMERLARCLLPRAAAFDQASGLLLVGCLGLDAVIGYDAMSAVPAYAEVRRWRVPAGPTGVAIDGGERRAVVWSQFERSLSILPLGAPGLEGTEGQDDRTVRSIALAPDPEHQLPLPVALGRVLFHASDDARVAADGRACASCHPEGRDDALTWATPNGPRRTRVLAGMLAGTAPYGWDGAAERIDDQLLETFRRLSGGGLRGLELRALSAYIDSLALPLAARAAPGDGELARGAQLFGSKQTGCTRCHAEPKLTDTRRHDTDSKTSADRDAAFDTPSLRGVGGRSPLFHDGRFATIEELLAGVEGVKGHSSGLSDEDRKALAAYLRTR